MAVEIQIMNGSQGFIPAALDGSTLTTERRGAPGKLALKLLRDDALSVSEGSRIRLISDGTAMFEGFIFTVIGSEDETVTVTAYDQLRYLKNKDTYVFEKATASQIVKMIARDYGLRLGEIDDTGYVIPARVMDNKTLLDMMLDSLEITTTNTRRMYCLYDDAGALTLKELSAMRLGLLIDAETGERFSYTSSIDTGTYNRVKLVYEDKKKGRREVFIAQDEETQRAWGTLQYFESITDTASAQSKADALLSLYNAKSRTLSVSGAVGDERVRGGSLVCVKLDVGGEALASFMLVEKCEHVFSGGRHRMNLKLRGGGFDG